MNPARELRFEDRIRHMTPVSAPPEQQPAVAALFREMTQLCRAHEQDASRCALVGPHQERILVPEAVFHVLERVAEILARGDAVTVVPVGKELTTQQAADLLNVSRQYLVRLLDQGRIPHTRTGRHRRVRIEDVLAFKERRDRERTAALDELTRLGQASGGYDDLK